MDSNCNICGSNGDVFYEDMYDDRYGFPGKYILLHCPVCGHKQFQIAISPELLTRLYTDYYPRSEFGLGNHKPYGEVNRAKAWFNGEYSSAFRWVPRNVRILDIGCGFGESLGYHRSRGCDAYGVEIDQNIARVADRFNYNVQLGSFDARYYDENFFDYVTMDQVIEHTASPLETLRQIQKVLMPGGRVIITTPNANGWGANLFKRRWIHWHVPYHMQFFSIESMKLAAGKANLIPDKMVTITNSKWLLFQWIHCATYPYEGTPSVFWSKKKERSPYKKLVMNVISAIHLVGINHLITRIIDMSGNGDNYLFVFRKEQR